MGPLLPLLLMTVSLTLACPRRTAPNLKLDAPQSAPAAPGLASRFGPGDILEVRVYREPELSGIHRLGPDGAIDFPFCGRQIVLGKSPAETTELLPYRAMNNYTTPAGTALQRAMAPATSRTDRKIPRFEHPVALRSDVIHA